MSLPGVRDLRLGSYQGEIVSRPHEKSPLKPLHSARGEKDCLIATLHMGESNLIALHQNFFLALQFSKLPKVQKGPQAFFNLLVKLKRD